MKDFAPGTLERDPGMCEREAKLFLKAQPPDVGEKGCQGRGMRWGFLGRFLVQRGVANLYTNDERHGGL